MMAQEQGSGFVEVIFEESKRDVATHSPPQLGVSKLSSSFLAAGQVNSGDGSHASTASYFACYSSAEYCAPGHSLKFDHGSQTAMDIDVEAEIEASKIHWSELTASVSVGKGERDKANNRMFEILQKQWGSFFSNNNGRLVVGKKIGEGAQANIFEAEWITGSSGTSRFEVVVKEFKGNHSLQDLQKQWPQGMLRNSRHGPYMSAGGNFSSIWGGTLLNNGRFAFWMEKFWGDLRKLIDLRVQQNNQVPPFLDCEAEAIMRDVAKGMRDLQKDNIVHKDLKSSNVLVSPLHKGRLQHDLSQPRPWRTFKCLVSDYECSVGVQGTRFWRAPEILLGQKYSNFGGYQHLNSVFTEKSDVYSFAMTCYEVITGQIPFKDIRASDYDIVLDGARPDLPRYVKPRMRALLNSCWHRDPLERPTFDEILNKLKQFNIADQHSQSKFSFRNKIRCLSN